jgi:hypothetical protein
MTDQEWRELKMWLHELREGYRILWSDRGTSVGGLRVATISSIKWGEGLIEIETEAGGCIMFDRYWSPPTINGGTLYDIEAGEVELTIIQLETLPGVRATRLARAVLDDEITPSALADAAHVVNMGSMLNA